jgi:hypothetical protein
MAETIAWRCDESGGGNGPSGEAQFYRLTLRRASVRLR